MKDCDACNLCCKLLAVQGLDKAPGQWCDHVIRGVGCGIYAGRPEGCREFNCHFLLDDSLSEAWRPSRARFFIHADGDPRTISLEVDPGSPLAWRSEPYYSQLKLWAERARTGQGRVLAHTGSHTVAIFPERDIDLGSTHAGHTISTGYRKGPEGMTPFARVERDGVVTEYV